MRNPFILFGKSFIGDPRKIQILLIFQGLIDEVQADS